MLNIDVKHAISSDRYAYPCMETMGDRIRALRGAKHLTQEQLGRACGVTKGAVSQWEAGSTANIKLATFLTLCDVLGTDPEFLIWGAERAPSSPSGASLSASGRYRRLGSKRR